GSHSIREYVSDLEELFTIVGSDSKRAKVVKLFNSFHASLWKALLREHFNPELTSWKTMVREAEYQEMAENVETRDYQAPSANRATSGHHDHHSHGRRSGKPHTATNSKSQPPAPGNPQSSRTEGAGRTHNGHGKPTPPDSRHRNGASRNCPDKSRITHRGSKPLGLGANSVRFDQAPDLKRTEQLRVNCLGETTASLSIGIAQLKLAAQYMDDNVYDILSDSSSKERNSDGDTIPGLQSVSDSSDDEDELAVQNYLQNNEPSDSSESDDYMLGGSLPDEEPEEEIMLAPPREYEFTYSFPIKDGEEKLFLIEMEEGPRPQIGQAAVRKVEDLLKIMQPYPGDPANVLQF
ncbi:hypothetical protein C0992_004258, partial [Termitomyces sp. T32_za158]